MPVFTKPSRLLHLCLLGAMIGACTPEARENRTGTVTDIDGNRYRTVTIAGKTWMAENLRVSRYRNGDPIQEVREEKAWAGLGNGASCVYENRDENGAKYGKLYNWHAVNDPRGLAPEGWHVASDMEWSKLVDATGGEQKAGSALKAAGRWGGLPGNRHEGFDALPSGARRDTDGEFLMLGQFARFWSSTAADGARGIARAMGCYDDAVRSGAVKKGNGFSVRCVQD